MLWYKAWLETRWRFLIGFVLLILSAAGVVFAYPQVRQLVPLASDANAEGGLARAVREGVALASTFRGYAWSQGFRQNLSNLVTLFAVLLGTGGLLSQSSGGAALYSLSMPASRQQLLITRATTGVLELLVLALSPALMLPLLAPAIGESFGVGAALVHGLCLFVAAGVFFSLAFLLSTIFSDLWRPIGLAFGAAVVVAACEQILRDLPIGIFRVMSAESYFRTGAVPWVGLVVSVGLSAALLWAALTNITRRDF